MSLISVKKNIISFKNMKLEQHNTKAFIGGSKVVYTTFPRRDKKLYTKQEVYNLMNEYKQKYENKSIVFEIAVEIPDLGFRSGKQFLSNQQPTLPDDYAWDETGQFVVYAWKAPSTQGGKDKNDKNNNCLWKCFCDARFPMNDIPFPWRSASKMKIQLGLSRDDTICYTHLPTIEQNIKVNINCIGDYEYTSPHNYLRTMTIKLTEGHYTLINDGDSHFIKSLSHKNQILILYFCDNENAICYNGKELFNKTIEEIQDEKSKRWEDWTFVKTESRIKQENHEMRRKTTDDLILEYKVYVEQVEQLKQATNGSIDMSRYRYSVVEIAKVLVYQHLKTLEKPDAITKVEEVWLMKTFKGGLIYGQDIQLEMAYEYDKNSAYPYYMKQPNFEFPIKEGVFQKLETLPDILSFGMYRVIVEPSNDIHINKLFRFNSVNYYTHYDLKMARELQLNITLVQDEEANCLLYQKNRMKGSWAFKALIEYLYELKLKNVVLVKEIISSIWGMLCERRKCFRIARPHIDKEIHIENATILSIIPMASGHRLSYMLNNKPFFLHDYARLGVFLTSRVRLELASLMLPHKEHIYRFHTDGFITDTLIPEINLGTNIGQYKLVKQGPCKITNCMKVDWL